MMLSKGMRSLSDEEIGLIEIQLGEGSFGYRNVCLFEMGCQTGFRVSELLSLKLGDVVKGGSIVDDLVMQKQYRKRKPESLTLYLPGRSKVAIGRWLRQLKVMGYQSRRDFLFQNRQNVNRAISKAFAYKLVSDAAIAAGLNGRIGTHSWRKTFAVRFYEHCKAKLAEGEIIDPLVETQQALGHDGVQSTIGYLNLKRQNTRRLSQEIFGT